jgi:hypothetical protein
MGYDPDAAAAEFQSRQDRNQAIWDWRPEPDEPYDPYAALGNDSIAFGNDPSADRLQAIPMAAREQSGAGSYPLEINDPRPRAQSAGSYPIPIPDNYRDRYGNTAGPNEEEVGEITEEELAASRPIPDSPKKPTSWTDYKGNVLNASDGWGLRNDTAARKSTGEAGERIIEARGIPEIVNRNEKNRLEAMTPQQRYDEYITGVKDAIERKTGIHPDQDLVSETEAKLKAKYMARDATDRDGNLLYDNDRAAYAAEMAKATRKQTNARGLLDFAIKGVQKDTTVSQNSKVISALGGPTQRGDFTMAPDAAHAMVDPIPGGGGRQSITVTDNPSQGGKGGRAGGFNADGTQNIPASQKLVSEALKMGAYQSALKVAQGYATKYDSILKEHDAIMAPGSKATPEAQADVTQRMFQANAARMLLTAMGPSGDSDKALKILQDPQVMRLFMSEQDSLNLTKQLISVAQGVSRQPAPPGGAQTPGAKQPGQQGQQAALRPNEKVGMANGKRYGYIVGPDGKPVKGSGRYL